MAASDLRNKNVSIYIDDQAAEDSLNRLQKAADGFNESIATGRKRQKELTDEIAKAKNAGQSYSKLEKELKKVTAEITKNEKKVNDNTAAQKRLQQQIDSGTGSSLRQQEALVKRLTNEYRNMAQGSEEARQKLIELEKASAGLNVMRERLDNVTRAQQQTAKSSGFLSSFFGNLAANLVVRAGAAVSGFFNDAVDEALEAEEATARLKNTLGNLGRTDVFDRLVDKADEMAERFKYLDNDEVLGVFKQLIDFGKLTEKQINDLLPVIINFAANQRISVQESASVIIKALAGQGKALNRYGIDIKDAKTESERLEIVMTTLSDKVKGAGEAFQETSAGGIASAKQEFKNLKEELGNGLLPVLNGLLGWINKVFTGLGYLGRQVKTVANDLFDLTVKGDLAVLIGQGEGRLKRLAEQQAKINKLVAKNIADEELAANSAGEAINNVTQRLLAHQQIVERGQKEGSIFSKEDIERSKRQVEILKLARAEIFKIQSGNANQNIGIGDGLSTTDPASAKEAERKREEELKRIKEFLAKVEKMYADAKFGQQLSGLSPLEQDIEKLDREFNELSRQRQAIIKDEKVSNDARLQLEEIYWIERIKLVMKYGDFAKDEFEKLNREIIKKQDDQFKRSLQAAKDSQKQLEQQINSNALKAIDEKDRNRLAAAELKAIKANGFKRLKAEKELLDEQKRQALENTNLTEQEKALIEEQFRKKKMETELEFWINLLQQTLLLYQQISALFEKDPEVEKRKEDEELARLQRTNEKKRAADQKLLNNKLISQQEFNRRSKKLDDDYNKLQAEQKRKQWERQQQADIKQAIIRGAQAVLSALATQPFLLGLALAVTAGIKTKKEIDTIRSQEVPEFAKGTLLNGPSHRDGGIDMVNPKTGQKVAEAEGGEALLSKRTVKNNPELVGALLQSSMYRNGERIHPDWKKRPYISIDYSGIIESSRKMKYYASGGVLADTINTNNTSTSQQTVVVPSISPEQEELLRDIRVLLQTPQKNYVVFSEIMDADAQINRIKDDAIFK